MKEQDPPRIRKGRSPEDKTADKRGDASEKTTENRESPSREEVISHWRDPITNQDEQEKITNSGGDDIPMPNK